MHDLTLGFTRQLGVALATFKAQQGHGVPPVSSGSMPFTVSDPQYLHGGPQYTFNDSIPPVIIGIFSFVFVFILTRGAFPLVRSHGTIERVLVSPITHPPLQFGY